MLRAELKKIFLYQKGALILLLALLAYAALCMLNGYDSGYVIDHNEAAYLSYIQRWQGQLTEQSAEELDAEYAAVNHAGAAIEQVEADYTTGKLSKSEYQAKLREQSQLQQNKGVLSVVYNQYFYVKDNPAHRFLMDERGWNTLLTHDSINFILILCLLALVVPVFCGEYQCGMDQILRSCRNGRSRLAIIKLFMVMLLAICVSLLFQLIQYAIISCSVGLNGFTYPLQSLSFFKSSPYGVTIGEAYGIVLLCRCIGAAWFTVMIALLSTLFKRIVLTAFAGVAFAVLPHLLGSSFLKYVLPLPAGLLSGTGYIWGKLTTAGYDSNWNMTDVVTFPGIDPALLGLLLAGYTILCGFLFYLCQHRYVGSKRKSRRSHILAGIVVLAVAFCMTGCSASTKSNLSFDFLAEADQGVSEDYEVRLDAAENKIYATDRQSGETLLLFREPFATNTQIASIFVTEQDCYYLLKSEIAAGFQIYCIDLTNFSEQLFFSNTDDNTADFWELYQKELTVDEILSNSGTISSFMVSGPYIYYVQDGQLRRIYRLTGHDKTLLINLQGADTLRYDNDEIIYKNQLDEWEKTYE